MKKPLKLLIYPQPIANNPVTFRDISTGRETTSMFYRDGGCLTSTPPPLDKSKRLTDAELAAEYWKAKERCMFVSAFSGFSIRPDSALAKQAEVLHRFATLPHYDEQP